MANKLFHKMRKWLREFCWINLRSLGNSPSVKLTIFIPIVGYFIIFNNYLLPYLDLAHDVFGKPKPNNNYSTLISWRIQFLYYGLWLLAIGSTIYQVFCPREIKRFESSIDYISHMFGNRKTTEFQQIKENINDYSRGDVFARGLFEIINNEKNDQISKINNFPLHQRESRMAKIEEEYERVILDLYYSLRKNRLNYLIYANGFFFYLGIGFVTFPSLCALFNVMNLTFSQIGVHIFG